MEECKKAGLPEYPAEAGSIKFVFHCGADNPAIIPQMEQVLLSVAVKTCSAEEIVEAMGLKDKRNVPETCICPAVEQSFGGAT